MYKYTLPCLLAACEFCKCNQSLTCVGDNFCAAASVCGLRLLILKPYNLGTYEATTPACCSSGYCMKNMWGKLQPK